MPHKKRLTIDAGRKQALLFGQIARAFRSKDIPSLCMLFFKKNILHRSVTLRI